MWLNMIIHFGGRGRQEWVQLMWGDIELKVDSTGMQYLQFNERETKTRKGEEGRKVPPRLFALPGIF